MIKAILIAAVGLIVAIIGIIIGHFSLRKGRDIIAIVGAFLMCIGGFTVYLGYDTYMMQPREYKVVEVREINNRYRITLDSNMKGMTNGAIFLTENEAKLYGFLDAENNLIAVKGAIPGAKGGIIVLTDSVKA